MTWLDIVVLVICAVSCVRGAMTGIIMQVASLAGIVLGAIFAGKIAEIIHPYMLNLIDNSENITGPLSYFIGFILILVAVNIIGRLVDKFVEITLMETVNKIAGAVFCCLKWILIVSILLNLLVEYDQNKMILKEEVRNESNAYPILIKTAQFIVPYLRFENFIPPNITNPQFQSIPVL